MRRSSLFAFFTICAVFGSILEVACSSDDSGGLHGASFGDDSGTGGKGDSSIGNPEDGSVVPGDGGNPGDGSVTGCTSGAVAVVGGGPSGSFAAYAAGGDALTAQSLTSPIAALPSIVSFGGSFTAVVHVAGSNQLASTSYAAGSWSALAPIAGTLVREDPALAVAGTTLHLVYQASDDAGAAADKYFHGTYSTSWTAGDPIGSGADQSFGAHMMGAAGLSSELVTDQVGSDNNVYARSFTSSWQSSVQMADGGVGSNDALLGTSARVVALTGGSAELLAVFTRSGDYKLMSIARTSGTWAAAPTLSNTNAYTTEPFQLAALAGGKAIVAWRGGDSHGYVSMYDGTSWSNPTAVAAFNIESAPAVSVGNCGSVAMAAYAKSGGGVEVVRYDGSAWGTPAAVGGTTGAKLVGLATAP